MKCIIRLLFILTVLVLLAVFPACKSSPTAPKDDVWTLLAQGDERAKDFFLGEFDVNAKDSWGRTPLHYAAELDDPVLTAFFIALGADLDAYDNYQQTPLGITAENGTVNAAELIVNAGGDIHKPARNNVSPARIALGKDEYLQAILTAESLNTADNNGKTILHIAVEDGNMAAIMIILTAINDTEGSLNTLMPAGSRNNPLDKRDSSGQNPLDIALSRPDSRNHMEIAEQLILSGSISSNPIYYYFAPAARDANYNLRRSEGMAPLHFAAREGHEGLIAFLFEKRVDVNIKNSSGSTPLHEAARSGRTGVISSLLRNGADVNAQDANENTALHLAVPPAEHIAVIRLLMRNRANPNLRDELGNTPLHVLITLNRSPDVVRSLLDDNVDISARNIAGQTPLHLAIEINRTALIPMLISAGSHVFDADNAGVTPFDRALDLHGPILDAIITPITARQTDDMGNTMLHAAVVKNADVRIIERIINNDVQTNALNHEGDTALHIAARENNEAIGVYIISGGSADIYSNNSAEESPLRIALTHRSGVLRWMFTPRTVESRDGMGNSMLHYVAQWRYDNHIPFIIQQGVHTETANAIGETPLFFAAKNNSPSTINALLSAGANLQARDSAGNSPLHSAVSRNAQNAAITLIETGIDVNTHNLNGTTPLHDSVGMGFNQMAVILLDRGAETEIRDVGGNTPFMSAVRSGFTNSAELLARRNANAMTRNINGDTPLHFAVLAENTAMIQILLGMNVSIHARNTGNNTPFQIALTESPAMLSVLLTGNLINSTDDFGNSPLHVALLQRVPPASLRTVIDRGTSLRSVDAHGRIPLRLAIDMTEWELAKILADAGSDPFSAAVDNRTPAELTIAGGRDPIRAIFSGRAINARDGSGNTVLHYAARMGTPESITLLLELGANRNIRNISAESPADIAMRWNNSENADLLHD